MAGSPGVTSPVDRVNEPLQLGKAGDVLGAVGGTLGDLGARTTAGPPHVLVLPVYQVWASVGSEWAVLAAVETDRDCEFGILRGLETDREFHWRMLERLDSEMAICFALRAAVMSDLGCEWGENREARLEELILLLL